MNDSIKAYIAGFLDGDGSIILQIKPRVGVRYGYRIYAGIRLYQDSTHEQELCWIGDQLKIGYLSRRNDGMSELHIDGYDRVKQVLLDLQDFIRFKQQQTRIMLSALEILKGKPTPVQFLQACKLADDLSNANYTSRRKYTAATVEAFLQKKGLLSP